MRGEFLFLKEETVIFKLRRVLLPIAALGILFAMPGAAQKRVMTAEDVVTMKAVSNPQISPDGTRVVFVMSEADLKANESFSHLWMVPAAGGEPRRFTWSLKNESAPQWSPDGKWIAFISNREGKRASDGDGAAKSQIWIIPAAGGEAQQLTEVKGGVSAAGFGGGGYSWSPDSKRIAFVSPEPADEEEQKRIKEKRDMIVVDKDLKMSRVWVIDVAGRQANQLTRDRLDATDPQWSPDGKQIAYVTRPSPKADDAVLGDIMVIPASGGTPMMLTNNEGPDSSPRWSPDSRFIAYLAGTKPQSGGQNDILVMPSTGGQPRNLTEAFDRNESNPIWSPDGKTIYFGAGMGTNTHLFSVPADGGSVKPLFSGDRVIGAGGLSKDGKTFVFTLSDPLHPADVWMAAADGTNARALTKMNPQVDDFKLGTTEVIRWKNPDGGKIEGLLVKPVDYQPGAKYPMIVEPHGGPAGVQSTRFNGMWQVMAGRGYVVFAPNFRGSDGYGRKHIEANVGKWGVVDFQDIMSGVDDVIAKGIADPDRLGVEGWSYGGYMSNFINTHSDRFKAAVPGAGMSNMISFFGTTDIQRFTVYYMTGRPWEADEIYHRSSPITNVAKAKAPALILHGEADRRVPIEQGEQMYMALKKNGIETEMVRYPREPHGFQEPNHQIDRIQRTVDWMDRFLKK